VSAPTTVPISGINGKGDYKIGAGAVTPIAVTKWSYKPDPKLLDRPNTTDGRRRIAALPDYELTIEVTVDTASTIDTDLQPGVLATVNLYTDGTKKYGPFVCIVGSVEFSNEIEGSYDAKFTMMMASGKTLPGPPA
jgi:hypothetical protein